MRCLSIQSLVQIRNAEVVLRLFEELVERNKTILMVTHDNDLAARTGRTVVIADGEIVDERRRAR